MESAVTSFAEIYSHPDIVRQFDFSRLEFTEGEFLRAVMRHPGDPYFLDLGIGAGRTTRFFAPLCGRYVGVDLAPGMVAHCEGLFATQIAQHGWQIEQADAADLSPWVEASFDFVFFSFNGLDCLSVADRKRCLREIHRVLRPGGQMLISSHNLQTIPVTYHADNPEITPERWSDIQRNNPPLAELADQPETLFWDGVYGADETVRHVYVRPVHQLAELARLGFIDAVVMQGENGAEVAPAELDHLTTFSLYYRATKPPNPVATETASGPR